jgi:hypothetical protein
VLPRGPLREPGRSRADASSSSTARCRAGRAAIAALAARISACGAPRRAAAAGGGPQPPERSGRPRPADGVARPQAVRRMRAGARVASASSGPPPLCAAGSRGARARGLALGHDGEGRREARAGVGAGLRPARARADPRRRGR